jgi:hypothetical protein
MLLSSVVSLYTYLTTNWQLKVTGPVTANKQLYYNDDDNEW